MDLGTANRRKGAGEIIFVLVLTAIILTICSFFILSFYFKHSGIAPGVYFLNRDLAGLRQDKALTRVEEIVSSTYSSPVYLKYKDQMWILRHNEHFKLNFDSGKIVLDALEAGQDQGVVDRIKNFIQLNYPRRDINWSPSLDRDYCLKNISRSFSQISQEKMFASYGTVENEIVVTMLSKNTTVNQIINELENSIKEHPVMNYRVIELENINKEGETFTCKIDDEKFGFIHPLSENSTAYDVNERAKAHNMKLVAEKLNGLIVNPSDIVSFNDLTGPRTLETGYEEVPLLLEDKIQTDVEGGVNQVATTLYKALIKCGLKICERSISNYYTPAIDYCKPGYEAYVRFGIHDLKFENNLDFPIMVNANLTEGQLQITITGMKKLPYTIVLRSGRLSKVAYNTRLIKDSSLLRGLEVISQIGIDGINVKVFRTYLGENERKLKEELLYDEADTYLARASIVRIGTGSADTIKSLSSQEKTPETENFPMEPTDSNDLDFMTSEDF